MSTDIEDMTPCTAEECARFRSATGMVGWLSSTGRCELRQYHSRVSQYMAAPVRGALDAVIKIVEYCVDNKDLCLFQPWGTEGVEWRFYTDSDQSSNTEINNKRRSQLSFIAMKGRAPIMFGSKARSVKFGPDLDSFGVDHRGLSRPRCHSAMEDFHADVSSAAAEIYAASVGLNEMLHLGYVSDEMGFRFPQPIELRVDNATLWCSARGRRAGRRCDTSTRASCGWRRCATKTSSSSNGCRPRTAFRISAPSSSTSRPSSGCEESSWYARLHQQYRGRRHRATRCKP